MDMILTGRPVAADEALAMGLINRLTPPGEALAAAIALADSLTRFPQACLRIDRASARAAFDRPLAQALSAEGAAGLAALQDAQTGAARFADGLGRAGDFEKI
jgi:enoyl-CoA hydratase